MHIYSAVSAVVWRNWMWWSRYVCLQIAITSQHQYILYDQNQDGIR